MKFKIIFSFISFINVSFFGQTLEIVYNMSVNTNNTILSKSADYSLLISNEKSIYTPKVRTALELYKYADENSRILEDDGKKMLVAIDDEHKTTAFIDEYYKDYQKDSLFYTDQFFTKITSVREKLSMFNWKIDTSSKVLMILGMKCQKATLEFRGREYEAYFTTEVSSNDGPWKFYGLPGLILWIKSKDDYLNVKAVEFNQKKEITNIDKPFSNSTYFYTWNEYLNLFSNYLIRLKKSIKNMEQEATETTTITIDFTDRIESLNLGIVKIEK